VRGLRHSSSTCATGHTLGMGAMGHPAKPRVRRGSLGHRPKGSGRLKATSVNPSAALWRGTFIWLRPLRGQQLTFPDDPFVALARSLDQIFRLATALAWRKDICYLIDVARRLAIVCRRPIFHKLTNLEFAKHLGPIKRKIRACGHFRRCAMHFADIDRRWTPHA
jgi:hypothetical protein